MSRLLLRNARIGLASSPRDVSIVDGRIAASIDGSPDESLELDGRTVLPGLWDAHTHMVQWAAARRRIDIAAATSAQEATALLAKNASDGVIFGSGFRDGLWPDQPHKDLLQAVMPDHPVVVSSNDLHTLWLSPAALAMVGAGDHPTGVLRERECFAAMAALPQADSAELDRWAVEATHAAAARGVVGVIDFEFADNVVDWRRRIHGGRVDVQVACSIPAAHLDEAIARGLRTGDPVEGTGGQITVGPVKIFVDGSLLPVFAKVAPGLRSVERVVVMGKQMPKAPRSSGSFAWVVEVAATRTSGTYTATESGAQQSGWRVALTTG